MSAKLVPGETASDVNSQTQELTLMFGATPLNVTTEATEITGNVKAPKVANRINPAETAVTDAMMASAPDLPFCLPFMSCNRPTSK